MRPGCCWLVAVWLGLATGAPQPRTADERLMEVVEREFTGHEATHRAAHKLHRSHHSHRVRHQQLGTLAPQAEIRCYCSLPACLTTGYMCQSMVGSCFSETVETDSRPHTRHGCLELLSRHKQRICERLHSENKADQRLRCCTEDMCNIVDDASEFLDLDTRIAQMNNGSLVAVPTPPAHLLGRSGGQQQQTPQLQQQRSGELWLRAATIAVPIAGLCILAGLVLLAVRLLRRETKPQYQYAKAPLCLEPALAAAPLPPSPTYPSTPPSGASLRVAGGSAAPAAAATHRGLVPVHCVVAPVDWRVDNR